MASVQTKANILSSVGAIV